MLQRSAPPAPSQKHGGKENRKPKKSTDTESLISALAKYEKSFQTCLAYDELPLEVCGSEELDLSQWTLVVTDACLGRVADVYRESNCEKAQGSTKILRSLDLSGGEHFGDAGLKALSDACPHLTKLSLENAYQVTDVGLKSIAQSCVELQNVSLSGCMGISGTGFAILGQYTHGLTSLRLSGCRQVKPWTFMKIFEGCRGLTDLDVSYCTLLTDRELKLLSDYCGGMESLNLKECKQVSDVGLLSLSQGCAKLIELNIGRSEMPFKVTDVSLLALSQGCRALASLSLRGCEMISDAGLSWLSKGCPNLEKLDLTNCSKVTNGGMRYLGEECPKLKSIILTNLKKVSDVGLRYLVDGCSSLEYLNGSGLYLLSDGIQRDFGFEGLQAMAGSKCADTVKKLNMHGCFQIRSIALNSIARFVNLENLTLSGCTKLTPDGLSEIAKSCTQVSQLSLASCGDCISDVCMEALAKGMTDLMSINVSDCSHVGRRGLRALSGCIHLRRLDASGCVGITDDAIMSLCSGRFDPGLETLDIARCHKVGDIALTYIVDGLQQETSLEVTLITLSLKGTSVKPATLKAVRDRFRYSTVKKNSSYFGFWPVSRPNDRKVINAHGKRASHATTIQAKVRALKDVQVVQKAREEYSKKKMAVRLGAVWRGYQVRRMVNEMRRTRWLRRVMALRLQCWFRVEAAKKRVRRMRHRRWQIVAPAAATVVQKSFRGWIGRKLATIAKLEHIQLMKRREEATIHIQAKFRMVRAQHERDRLFAKRAEEERRRNKCATQMQQAWRLKKANQMVYFRRTVRQALVARQHRASRTVQRCFWKHRLRATIKSRIIATRTRIAKATLIQRWMRERYATFEERAVQARILAEIRQRASIIIQCFVRQWAACIQVGILRHARAKLEALKEAKARVLCRWWRWCLARHKVQLLRIERKEYMRREIQLHSWAATKIAAGWRGRRGRDKALRVKVDRMERWKQLWSSDENRKFYFNQITGETRWRKPQMLLDLEPRPTCSNCSFYEAQFECADCSEFFCQSCWEAVHYGGKRAHHSFRSLFDFYGKRIDYGDGEFPSLWPTDIEQDDRAGWHER